MDYPVIPKADSENTYFLCKVISIRYLIGHSVVVWFSVT